MERRNPWKTLNSRVVYENPWVRLREDEVIRPDGNSGIYSVLEVPLSIGVVALNDRDEIPIVGQWRYAHKKFSWEIPTGGSNKEDKTTLDAAKRELTEETGLVAETWISLGSIDNSNSATTEVANLFLATNLTLKERHQEPDEKIEVIWIDFSKAVEMVMRNEITESCSVAGILKVERLRSSYSFKK